MTVTIGVMGAGAMGGAMVQRLLERKRDVVVHDPRPDAVDALVRAGATAAVSPAAVAEVAQIALLVLPDPAAVVDVTSGEDGLLAVDGPLEAVIDLTTSSPETSRTVAGSLAELSIAYADVGVLGNPPTARSGQMTLLVGGLDKMPQVAVETLEELAAKIRPMGAVGAGHAAKLVANALFLSQVATMGEALSTLEAVGGDPDLFLEALEGLGGRGAAIADIGRTMRSPQAGAGFALRLAAKDARLLAELAERADSDAPITNALAALFARAADVDPDGDFTRVYAVQRPRSTDTRH